MDDLKTKMEIDTLKEKLKATWEAGDFGEIAKSFEQGAEDFVTRLALLPKTSVLDVACGSGNTAIPAARTGAEVTGVDLAAYVIKQAADRAERAGIKAAFDVGDVEDLQYEDGAFDTVITMFGAMFAPKPELAMSEMKRVCRRGGSIAMANWTPSGFIGQMFKITAKFVPPPAGMPSPLLWGDPETVRERLGDDFTEIEMTPRMIAFDFPFGPGEVVEHFRKFYGPTQKAFAVLDPAKQDLLRKGLVELWSANNSVGEDRATVYSEYLEVRAVRK